MLFHKAFSGRYSNQTDYSQTQVYDYAIIEIRKLKQKAPGTHTNAIISEYLKLLSEQDYAYSDELNDTIIKRCEWINNSIEIDK